MGKRMVKLWHSHINWILLSNKNQWAATHSNVDESHRMLNNNKKSQKQEFISYDSIYLKFRSRPNSSVVTEDRIMLWRYWRGGGAGGRKDLAGVLEMFHIDLGGVCPGVYMHKSSSSCKHKICAFHSIYVIPQKIHPKKKKVKEMRALCKH